MKYCVLFLCFLGCFAVANGQADFGIKGGINLANVTGIGGDNNRACVGYYAGGFARVTIADQLLLQPELLYSVKGYRLPAGQNNAEATVSFNYISIPLLAGYQPSGNFTVFLGPELGFMTSAKSKFGAGQNDIYSYFRHFDLGIDLGAAYSICKSFGIDLRYNYGFNDLANVVYTDQNGTITGQGRSGANRVLQAGVYYRL